MAKHTLLVEGSGDREFFVAYCEILFGKEAIDVSPPKGYGAGGNGWGNLLNILPTLMPQLRNGDLARLGLVLDADYPKNQGGFQKRWEAVKDELAKHGFAPDSNDSQLFRHSELEQPVGVWIMPDHQHDGMLEDFVQSLVTAQEQQAILQHAQSSIDTLPHQLFDAELRTAKATVCTWRAWQKEPGASLGQALKNGLLDRTKAVDFENWLKKVFA